MHLRHHFSRSWALHSLSMVSLVSSKGIVPSPRLVHYVTISTLRHTSSKMRGKHARSCGMFDSRDFQSSSNWKFSFLLYFRLIHGNFIISIHSFNVLRVKISSTWFFFCFQFKTHFFEKSQSASVSFTGWVSYNASSNCFFSQQQRQKRETEVWTCSRVARVAIDIDQVWIGLECVWNQIHESSLKRNTNSISILLWEWMELASFFCCCALHLLIRENSAVLAVVRLIQFKKRESERRGKRMEHSEYFFSPTIELISTSTSFTPTIIKKRETWMKNCENSIKENFLFASLRCSMPHRERHFSIFHPIGGR